MSIKIRRILNLFLGSTILVAPFSFLYSCKGSTKIDISSFKFTSDLIDSTIYISSKNPTNVLFEEILNSVSNSPILKETLLNSLAIHFGIQFDSIKDTEFKFSIAQENLEDSNFTSPTLLNYAVGVTVVDDSSILFGSFTIPENTLKVQAFPSEAKIDLSKLAIPSISFDTVFKCPSTGDDNQTIFNAIIHEIEKNEIDGKPFSTYISSKISEYLCQELNKIDTSYKYEDIPINPTETLSLDYSNVSSITRQQMYDSYHSDKRISVDVGVSLLNNSLPVTIENKTSVSLTNISISFEEFNLKNLDFSVNENNEVPIYLNADDYRRQTIVRRKIEQSIYDAIDDKVFEKISNLPILQVLTKDSYTIEFPNIQDYENFKINQPYPINVSIVSNETYYKNPLEDSFDFIINIVPKDVRIRISSESAIDRINQVFHNQKNNAFYVTDITSPKSADPEEIKHEIQKNASIRSVIEKNILLDESVSYGVDYTIDFYSDTDETYKVKEQDYSISGTGENPNEVYIIISAVDTSTKIAGDTENAHLSLPILVSGSAFDLSKLDGKTLGSEDSPDLSFMSYSPENVSYQELYTAITNPEKYTYKHIWEWINKLSDGGITTDDVVISVDQQNYDLTRTAPVNVHINKSESTKSVEGSATIKVYVRAFQQNYYIDKCSFTTNLISMYVTNPSKVSRLSLDSFVQTSTELHDQITNYLRLQSKIETITKADYEIVLTLTDEYYDLSSEKVYTCLEIAPTLSSKKIAGSFVASLRIRGINSSDEHPYTQYVGSINADSRNTTNPAGEELSYDTSIFDLTISSINISMMYDSEQIRKIISATPDEINKAHDLNWWISKNVIDPHYVYAWLSGSYRARNRSFKVDFSKSTTLLNLAKDGVKAHYERVDYIYSSPGFFSGNQKDDNRKDAVFDAFSFYPVKIDNTHYKLKYGWSIDNKLACPNLLRWGAKSMADLYANNSTSSAFHYLSSPAAAALSETWD